MNLMEQRIPLIHPLGQVDTMVEIACRWAACSPKGTRFAIACSTPRNDMSPHFSPLPLWQGIKEEIEIMVNSAL